MEKIVISIPEPCHENWQAMSPTEQGRFCLSCQKQVVDFSVMEDKEIYKLISQGNANMCGHFASNQLNKTYNPVTEKRTFWHRYFFAALVPALLWGKQSYAQKINTKTAVTNNYDNIIVMGFMVARKMDKRFEITAVIIDSVSKMTIPFASIKCSATNSSETADSLGAFHIKSKTKVDKIMMMITAVGYEPRGIEIAIPTDNFTIVNDTIMGGKFNC